MNDYPEEDLLNDIKTERREGSSSPLFIYLSLESFREKDWK